MTAPSHLQGEGWKLRQIPNSIKGCPLKNPLCLSWAYTPRLNGERESKWGFSQTAATISQINKIMKLWGHKQRLGVEFYHQPERNNE